MIITDSRKKQAVINIKNFTETHLHYETNMSDTMDVPRRPSGLSQSLTYLRIVKLPDVLLFKTNTCHMNKS